MVRVWVKREHTYNRHHSAWYIAPMAMPDIHSSLRSSGTALEYLIQWSRVFRILLWWGHVSPRLVLFNTQSDSESNKEILSQTIFHARETKMCAHQELAATSQLFYLPHKCGFIRCVLDCPCRGLQERYISDLHGQPLKWLLPWIWGCRRRRGQEHKSRRCSLYSVSWTAPSPSPHIPPCFLCDSRLQLPPIWAVWRAWRDDTT